MLGSYSSSRPPPSSSSPLHLFLFRFPFPFPSAHYSVPTCSNPPSPRTLPPSPYQQCLCTYAPFLLHIRFFHYLCPVSICTFFLATYLCPPFHIYYFSRPAFSFAPLFPFRFVIYTFTFSSFPSAFPVSRISIACSSFFRLVYQISSFHAIPSYPSQPCYIRIIISVPFVPFTASFPGISVTCPSPLSSYPFMF